MKKGRGVLGALAGLALAAIVWGAVPSLDASGASAAKATAAPTSAELTRRLAEAHPGPNPFVQYCDAHKDNLYTRRLP